jgi:hypothetical protein
MMDGEDAKANFPVHYVNLQGRKDITVTKITLTLNANKVFGIPGPSMRHVAVVNAIYVKQKNHRTRVYHPRGARRR